MPPEVCWPLTIHKAQGQTQEERAVSDFGNREAFSRFTCVYLSRVRRIGNLLLASILFDRIARLGDSSMRNARLQ